MKFKVSRTSNWESKKPQQFYGNKAKLEKFLFKNEEGITAWKEVCTIDINNLDELINYLEECKQLCGTDLRGLTIEEANYYSNKPVMENTPKYELHIYDDYLE